jgi:hypothetical protein
MMNGAVRARSAELPRELVKQARMTEDDAWAAAAEMRRRQEPGGNLLVALRLLEKATAGRVRLEEELKGREPKA